MTLAILSLTLDDLGNIATAVAAAATVALLIAAVWAGPRYLDQWGELHRVKSPAILPLANPVGHAP
jgi:hypothetical protein